MLSPGLKVGLAHVALKAMYQRDGTPQELVDLANSIHDDGSNFADLVQQLATNALHPDGQRIDSVNLANRLDRAGIP